MNVESRTGKELIGATRPFARERRAESVWHLSSGLLLMVAGIGTATTASPVWLRAIAVVFSALMILRVFIIYHDFMHGALLRGSLVAKVVMYAFGLLVLAPPRVWKRSHDYHHAHTAVMAGSHVGSFPTVNTPIYRVLSPLKRLAYRAARHPLTIALGYFTVFLWGMVVGALLRNPRKSYDAALSLMAYGGLAAVVTLTLGFEAWAVGIFLPHFLACAIGSYLFYAQHNFPGMVVRPRATWSYVSAALEASSFMESGPLMRWFSGNIGYHHVHHLNPSIPFYRLPEAMAAIPELHNPGRTSLRFRDIVACLRLKVWDPERGSMGGFPEASARDPRCSVDRTAVHRAGADRAGADRPVVDH